MLILLRLFIMGVFFIVGMSYARAGFEEDVRAYLSQDFQGQDVRMHWDHPDRIGKLPVGVKITAYENLGGGRVQFRVEGQDHPLLGKADFMVDVPTLRAPFAKGSVIREEDIIMQKMPMSQVPGDAVLQSNMLIGKAPKNTVQPALTAIKSDDLIAPKVIKQNDIVTVIYKSQSLTLATKGKALKGGSVGDRVSFEIQKHNAPENQKHIKKYIDAVVVDGDTAIVKVAEISA